MIGLHRLNGKWFCLNAELVKYLEKTPDTMIVLTTGEKFMVKESIDEVCQAIISYKKMVFSGFSPVGEVKNEIR